MADDPKPDPSQIGGVPDAPFALTPDPTAIFAARARRFAFLGESGNIGSYLRFLAAIAEVQREVCATFSPVALSGRPAIDRAELAVSSAMDKVLSAFCEKAARIDMPDPARAALDSVASAGPAARHWLLANVAQDEIPPDAAAEHLFAAAALQIGATCLAGTLNASDLRPLATGRCPACGGKPVTSSVVGTGPVKNLRYCSCATCATQWNEVRIKCLCCGSTKGISYKSVETEEATVKAECCDECRSWVKILYQVKNRSLDPVADDVGSLGLDLMMRDSGYVRGGFHPFLAGF